MLLLVSAMAWPAGAVPFPESTFFEPGPDGYPVFRIPSLITAPDSDLLAFSEARPRFQDAGAGTIDVVSKRSSDGSTRLFRLLRPHGAR